MDIYVVKPGDSIYKIARENGLDQQKIISDNALSDPSALVVGQSLILSRESIPYTVKRGDSLYSIARRNGITLSEIQAANPEIESPFRLEIGQVINIPPSSKKLGTIYVNGYAFPNISKDTLDKTLPNLTYLSIFSYQVRPDGTLITINDTPLIDAAKAAKVAPVMVITNIEEGGSFSSDLASTILNSEEVQNTLLDNVVRTLEEKDYYGLDIDFEYIYSRDGDAYDRFLRKVSDRLSPLGYILTTSLAPKISEDQPGLLYEAHHYPVHGELMDHVILMTYEWGYTYGPPMAVSPVQEMQKVLNYAVSVIPSEKILMGMPNYGYNWTLPYRRGTAARTISNTVAVELAREERAAIEFDTVSQTPFFNYTDDSGNRHVVWFDDARSIEAKLRLVDEYNLGGVSYWTVNRFFPQNWIVLNSMYDIIKVL